MFPVKKILCPVDFNDKDVKALKFADEIAKAFGSELTVTHVFKLSSLVPDKKKLNKTQSEKFETKAKVAVTAKLNKLIEDNASKGTEVNPKVLKGNIPDEITKFADQSGTDIIVMHSNGRGKIKRFLFGSTLDKVIRSSPCPVITVHSE